MVTVTGASTAGLLSPADRWSKATVHPIWRNRSTGKYSAIVPTATAWNLVPDLSVPGTSSATGKTDQNLRPTVVTAADGYYVIWASPTASKIQKYTWSNVASGTEYTVPLTVINHDQSPLTAVMDSLGRIWVARGQAGVVQVARSTDSGATWSGPTQIGTFGASSTGVIGLVESAGFMQTISNGNDSSGRSAKRIALSATDLAQANWTVETLPAFASGAASDDHLGITAAADGTVYAVLKTTNGATNVQLIYILVRTPAGTWSSYNVEVGPDDDGGTSPGYSRPNLVLVGTTLTVFYGSIYSPTNLSYKTMSTTTPGTFSARQVYLAGPDFSDGALVPGTGEIVPPVQNWPLLANRRSTEVIEVLSFPTGFPQGGGSMIGANPVLATRIGTELSPKTYLGTGQVSP